MCKKPLTRNLIAAAIMVAALLFGAARTQAACGTGLGGTIGLSDTNGNTIDSSSHVHIGDTIVVSLLEVQNQDSSYRATGIVASVIFPNGSSQTTMNIPNLRPGASCDSLNGGLQGLHCPGGTAVGTLPPGATCVPFVNTYVVTFADVTNTAATVSCIGTHPTASTILFKQIAVGTALTAAGTVAGNATACEDISVPVIFPCITVTKGCAQPCFAYGSSITFTGAVCNTGDSPLSNVQVIDQPSGQAPVVVTNIISLAAGQCVNFSGTYTPTGNPCGPFTDTITATGVDLSGRTITNTDACINPATGASTGPRPPVTATCPVCTAPNITVTKVCPATNGIPGGLLGFSGTVCNTGNVPLTNVTIVDDHTLSTGGNIVATFPLLPIGACSNFSGTLNIPSDVCSITDILTATGTNVCPATGTAFVSAKATNTCPVLTTPALLMNKLCPATNGIPGGVIGFTVTVTNVGNVAVTNIVVSNAELGNTTPVGTIPRLEPGQGAVLSGTESVPTDVCSITNTVTATGVDVCLHSVTTNATAICPVLTTPKLLVNKLCPATNGIPGGVIGFSVTVTNVGNVAVTNIVVVNVELGNSTTVGTIARLEPNQGAVLNGTESVPNDVCSITNTVNVTGVDVCLHSVATNATAICPVLTTPKLLVNKLCPATNGLPGGVIGFTVTVTNVGNVAVTNIVVSNAELGNTTPVGTIARLEPGQGTVLSGTESVPTNVCSITNTVTATGTDVCLHTVTTNATATCPVLTTPRLALNKICPATNGLPGGVLGYTGTITNVGNVAVTNIVIVNNVPAPNTPVTTIARLEPGQGATFSGTDVIPPNTCSLPDTLTATAHDVCGNLVTTNASANCPITCAPQIKVWKQVVCFSNACEPFSANLDTQKSAFGVRIDPANDADCPAFCYRIIVTNLGNVTLSNLVVSDSNISDGKVLNLSGCGFPATLAPAGQPGSSASCIVTTNHCVTSTNIVTATALGQNSTGGTTSVSATDTNSVTVVPISVACTLLVSTNGGATFVNYDGGCASQLVNNPYIVRIVVTNTGQYDLQNVTIGNIAGFTACFGTATNIGLLPVGGAKTIDCSNTCGSAPSSNYFAVSVTAEASQALRHVCDFNIFGQHIVATSQCSTCVKCVGIPAICVTKQIACFLGTNSQGSDVCGTFGPSAIGVEGDTQLPAFCYSITVSNCGTIALTNVHVIDDKYGDLTADFACVSPTFAVGAHCTFEFKVELPAGPNGTINVVTNTVTATGCSVFNTNQCVNAQAQAVATIIPASVACIFQYTIDGGPLTNNVIIRDQNPHTIVWYLTVINTGIANLADIFATDEQGNLGCGAVTVGPFNLDSGAQTTFPVCTNASFVCSNSVGISSTIMVTANEFSFGTNHISVCAHDLTGTNIVSSTNFSDIVVRSECSATLGCSPPNACRVTGGGRQDVPTVCPSDVRYVTHGGQVGAPVGNKVCVINTNLPDFFLGNPCIHGRWTHVRHMQGGGEGNFHARFFDTLDCACLDTNLNTQTCQYGPGTVLNGICNPGDRLAGPEPRKAPANKIAFTGVGDWTCEKGGREPRACLFRVDIEDRGEPGNDHVLDLGHKPGRIPDRYRIRIWVLTDAEKLELKGAGPDPYLIHFRDCISACNGINYQDGGAIGLCGAANSCSGDTCTGEGSTGTITFPGGCPVRTPNIDDGGELLHGNHQIHPSIMNCDPANPTGPGLANP